MFMANHPIAHIEIPAVNPDVVGTFYHDVFGWKIETNPEGCAILFCKLPESAEAPWRRESTNSKSSWRLTTKSTCSPMCFPSDCTILQKEEEGIMASGVQGLPPLTEREVSSHKFLSKIPRKDGDPKDQRVVNFVFYYEGFPLVALKNFSESEQNRS
jgi:hypothetical protein